MDKIAQINSSIWFKHLIYIIQIMSDLTAQL